MIDEDTLFNSLVFCVSVILTAIIITCLKVCVFIQKRHVLQMKKDGLTPLLSTNASLSTTPN